MAFSSTPDEITASMALLGLSSHSPPSSTFSPSTFSFEKRNEETNQNKNSPKLKKWRNRIRERNEKQRVEIEQNVKNSKETEVKKMEFSSSSTSETSKKESEKAAPKMIGENNPGLISMEDRLMAERLCKLKSMVSEE
ncbi:hypothetical protein F8388_010956 [Cannabis sativa]|uniref:Uncharacterized protein n=1 Tax=Cannabis sativa TaxID=3483 RepID=A0A7J6EEG2_CANSA|nr:hypothetical protein F8388_010956 [Cannabis sativa]KAF4396173.1 hypothetical protein G4B88_020810 [Cannabis sativa]